MQLKVTCNLTEPLRLPINYHHILQAVIYQNLKADWGYNDFVHDNGYWNKKKVFKMFTFGPIQGRYRIENRFIFFEETISFEVRSAEGCLIKILCDNLQKKGIVFGETVLTDVKLQISNDTVENSEVVIQMLSPICIYSTNPDSGKTYYYAPEDDLFAEKVNDNFKRKYAAYTGMEAIGDIGLQPLQVTAKDKYVTNYKGIYITAWKGKYLLNGERKYLDFLYQVGLGGKNAQGFGMFSVAKDDLRA